MILKILAIYCIIAYIAYVIMLYIKAKNGMHKDIDLVTFILAPLFAPFIVRQAIVTKINERWK